MSHLNVAKIDVFGVQKSGTNQGEVFLEKIQKNSYNFSGNLPLSFQNLFLHKTLQHHLNDSASSIFTFIFSSIFQRKRRSAVLQLIIYHLSLINIKRPVKYYHAKLVHILVTSLPPLQTKISRKKQVSDQEVIPLPPQRPICSHFFGF